MAEPTCQHNWLISADNGWRWKFSTGWDGLGADLGPDSSEAVAAGSEGRLQGGLAGCQVAGAVPGIVHTLPTTCPVHSQQPGQADPWIRQWTGIVWAFLHSVGGGIPKVIGAAAGRRLKMEQGAGKRCLKSSGKVDWVGRVMEVENGSGLIHCKVHLSPDWFIIPLAKKFWDSDSRANYISICSSEKLLQDPLSVLLTMNTLRVFLANWLSMLSEPPIYSLSAFVNALSFCYFSKEKVVLSVLWSSYWSTITFLWEKLWSALFIASWMDLTRK